jgi:hypothetical protein
MIKDSRLPFFKVDTQVYHAGKLSKESVLVQGAWFVLANHYWCNSNYLTIEDAYDLVDSREMDRLIAIKLIIVSGDGVVIKSLDEQRRLVLSSKPKTSAINYYNEVMTKHSLCNVKIAFLKILNEKGFNEDILKPDVIAKFNEFVSDRFEKIADVKWFEVTKQFIREFNDNNLKIK